VDDRPAGGAEDPPAAQDTIPGSGAVRWGPARWISGVTLTAMLAALAWHFLAHDPEDRLVAAVLGVAAALSTLALVRLSTRLAAGPGGLLVREVLHTRRIGWDEIAGVNTPLRGRWGVTNPALEIDLMDDSLYVFGRFDLGVPPAEVRRELVRQHGGPLPRGSSGSSGTAEPGGPEGPEGPVGPEGPR
jgi:hypothetical protein